MIVSRRSPLAPLAGLVLLAWSLSPARARAAEGAPGPATGTPYTVSAALLGGWTDQVGGGNAATVQAEVSALARFDWLRAGVMGRAGWRGETFAPGLDLAAGPSWLAGRGRRLDALATAGVTWFSLQAGTNRPVVGDRWTGGNAFVPALGARILLGPDEAFGPAVGLFVERSIGGVTASYRDATCSPELCGPAQRLRYGGTAIGVVFQVGTTRRHARSSPPPGT